jgi:hypothetical protein
MSWVTIIWSMVASACLTLAGMHFLTWWQRRMMWADLLFALLSVAFASFAGGELAMMRAETPEQFATTIAFGPPAGSEINRRAVAALSETLADLSREIAHAIGAIAGQKN